MAKLMPKTVFQAPQLTHQPHQALVPEELVPFTNRPTKTIAQSRPPMQARTFIS